MGFLPRGGGGGGGGIKVGEGQKSVIGGGQDRGEDQIVRGKEINCVSKRAKTNKWGGGT